MVEGTDSRLLHIPDDHCSKGLSASAIPFKRTPPSWLKVTPDQVNEHVCKLAKKGLTPSQIGILLRDSHGIGRVKSVTGTKILRILKANGVLLNCTPIHTLIEAWRRKSLRTFTTSSRKPSMFA